MGPRVQEALRCTFGLEALRGHQAEAIDAVLAGRDVLLTMPTGAGKSLVYQLPAIVLDGVTLVVSPLIALMKDQVDGLRARGIRATYVNSSISGKERQKRLNAAERGEIDLLFVTPERFRQETGALGVKLARSGGGFDPPLTLTGPGPRDRKPASGDFDGDGHMDVLVAAPSGLSLQLYRGLGNGSFAAALTAIATTEAPGRIDVVDLDRDGLDDIVWSLLGGSRIAYAFGHAAGPLTDAGVVVGDFPQTVRPAIDDFNSDGRLDLAFLVTDRIEMAIQLSGRTFAARTQVASFPPLLAADVAVAGDLDVDGTCDLLVPGRFRLLGLGTGLFGAPIPISGPLLGSPELFDYDLDGDPDLIIQYGGDLVVSENSSVAPFESRFRFDTVAPGSRSIDSHTIVDVDGDGDPDVVTAISHSGLYVHENLTLSRVGEPYCGPSTPNSTGHPGETDVYGRIATGALVDELRLVSLDLPLNAFGYYLCSRTQDDVLAVPNSVGRLCLGGSIGRFIGPGQVLATGSAGRFSLTVETSALATPNLGLVQGMAGETWNFQGWHRDTAQGGGLTSNFTSAVAVAL